MLQRLRIENYRCFQDHEIHFGAFTIAVGRNNAGKTTVSEALRLVSLVTGRYRGLQFRRPPRWLDIPASQVGVSPSLKGLDINYKSLFHRYEDPPATVTAYFDEVTITVHIGGQDKIHAVIGRPSGRVAKSRAEAVGMQIPVLEILPPIGPLSHEEVVLSPEYVMGSLSTRLSSAHFRNQLRLMPGHLEEFGDLSQESWPGIQIRELHIGDGLPGDAIELLVRDGEFVTEVGNMGHGLQMWLQTMWFLARVRGAGSVILDEPDVYMHPDLQRRLVRLIRKRYPQVIVTTHSTEIMAEATPDEILIVDRTKAISTRATSAPAVQRIVASLGSIHNLHLARLFSSSRFLLVEGKDIGILKAFQDLIVPETVTPMDAIPRMAIGGWGGWQYAVGSSMFINNAADERIHVYCILDSDYHVGLEVLARKEEARSKGVDLHVWERKEIENYLLVPDAICAAIASRKPRRTTAPSVEEVATKLDEVVASLMNDALDGISHSVLSQDRALGVAGANRRAREVLQERSQGDGGARAIVSGKKVLAAVFAWSQVEFGVSLNTSSVVSHIPLHAVPDEIKRVILSIDRGIAL